MTVIPLLIVSSEEIKFSNTKNNECYYVSKRKKALKVYFKSIVYSTFASLIITRNVTHSHTNSKKKTECLVLHVEPSRRCLQQTRAMMLYVVNDVVHLILRSTYLLEQNTS